MIAQARSRRPIIIFLTLITILSLIWLNPHTRYPNATSWTGKPDLTLPNRSRRITKVSMLYGDRNSLYERALQSHRRHAERWGYGMDVLQHGISVGYWNKPTCLLSLVIQELTRPAAERVEWLMWVDADSVVINPAIPLEIFLPPHDVEDIHIVATKDHKGLNTGIFFLRVHQWTVKMLIEALGYPVYNPKVDLGVQVDQSAMEKVLTQSTYKEGLTYLPRTWINTYEWAHDYEGTKGNFQVHFPGLGEQRSAHMSKWLDIVERTPEEWEVPVRRTWYLSETEAFWERIRTARKIAVEYEKKKAANKGPSPMSSTDKDLEAAVNELKKVLYEEPYEAELLQQRIDDWKVVSEKFT
ncbi:hypothetical protein BDV12DRAFT_193254 [Aspergillus spectabilis]